MATTEDSNDALWNQSVCNKSWVDIMEEEERDVFKKNSLRDSTNTKHIEHRVPVRDEPVLDESAVDITITSETKEIKIQPSDVLPNFSVSHVKREEDSSKENSSQHRPNEQPKDFLQDDLSLTSHLHGFQLVSPCKVDHKTPTKTPSKASTISHYLGKADHGEGTSSPSQVTKRKLQTDDLKDSAVTDEMLMPSPSKIRRQATPTKKSLQNTPKQRINTPKQAITPNFLSYTPTNRLTRKRSRELTPGSSERKREIETDPEVIARRQKQIDYGKNTIGYDRYRQLVPKEARQKMHPKTPPIHIKFSRRAWDGMVKIWRQRLHFWDPPSEGGGDPKCLEMDEVSDASSTEGSLPPTPVQERKRQCWQRTPSGPSKELKRQTPSQPEEDDDNQGCTPLPPE